MSLELRILLPVAHILLPPGGGGRFGCGFLLDCGNFALSLPVDPLVLKKIGTGIRAPPVVLHSKRSTRGFPSKFWICIVTTRFHELAS
jgi:hypothetical protein